MHSFTFVPGHLSAPATAADTLGCTRMQFGGYGGQAPDPCVFGVFQVAEH